MPEPTSWLSPLIQRHAAEVWTLDASTMKLSPDDLDELGWDGAFDEMEALEDGAVANVDESRQVGHYWLRAFERAPTIQQAQAISEITQRVSEFVDDVRMGRTVASDGEPFECVLHVGIGGSALGPRLVVSALLEDGGLPVVFLDNTDPDGIARALSSLGTRLRRALVVTVTKSGRTPETLNALNLVVEALIDAGIPPRRHLVAISGSDSPLWARAQKEQWLATFPLWDFVGGRTSVTSAVGLLSAGLAGIDTESLLRGARDMDSWTRTRSWRDNPAALLAGCWYLSGNGKGERAMVAIPYADRLATLASYLQQLIMESVGKRLDRQGNQVDQGLTVYGNKGSTDQHAYVQQLRDGRDDFFVLLVQVLGRPRAPTAQHAGDMLQGFLLGTRRALIDSGRLAMTLTIRQVDAYTIGGLIALFERAVGLYASLIDVNAYHQPGVEAGKKAAAGMQTLSSALLSELKNRPATVDELATACNADATEVWYLLERLTLTGRLIRTGAPPSAIYETVRG